MCSLRNIHRRRLRMLIFLFAKALLITKLVFDFMMVFSHNVEIAWDFSDDNYVEGMGYVFLLIQALINVLLLINDLLSCMCECC